MWACFMKSLITYMLYYMKNTSIIHTYLDQPSHWWGGKKWIKVEVYNIYIERERREKALQSMEGLSSEYNIGIIFRGAIRTAWRVSSSETLHPAEYVQYYEESQRTRLAMTSSFSPSQLNNSTAPAAEHSWISS